MRVLVALLVLASAALLFVDADFRGAGMAPIFAHPNQPSLQAAGVVKDDGAEFVLPYIDDPETGVRCYYTRQSTSLPRVDALSCVRVRESAEEVYGRVMLAEKKRKEQVKK